MNRNARLLFAFLLLPLASIARAEGRCADEGVTGRITAEAQRLIGDDEHAVQREPTLFELDLDGDRLRDCVAYFSIEGWGGSNAWTTYLAYFRGEAAHRQRLVSVLPLDRTATGPYGRMVDRETAPEVIDGRLVVNAMEWADDDPHCCPSIERQVRYGLRGPLGLVEERTAGEWAAEFLGYPLSLLTLMLVLLVAGVEAIVLTSALGIRASAATWRSLVANLLSVPLVYVAGSLTGWYLDALWRNASNPQRFGLDAAGVALLFLTSWLLEGLLLRATLQRTVRPRVWRAAMWANLLPFTLLLILKTVL